MSSRSIEPTAETSLSARRGFPLAIRLGFHPGPLPGEPADATFATVAGTRVHYVDQGMGPAVVLVHGFCSSLEIWSQLVPELDRKSTRLNSSHQIISYAVFCLKKKNIR